MTWKVSYEAEVDVGDMVRVYRANRVLTATIVGPTKYEYELEVRLANGELVTVHKLNIEAVS